MRNIVYVSFDVYDTLIKRILCPKKLYQAMENSGYKDFAKQRLFAEEELKKQGKHHYTLKDIYHMGEFARLDENTREKMIRYEERCEIQNTIPNEEGRRLYTAYSKKYRLICISDMYLSSTVIREILEKNGYTNIEKVYVSGDERKSKKQGELFKFVLKDLNISRSKLLHIGDAIRSDFLIPKYLGLSSKLIIERSKQQTKKSEILYNRGFLIFGPAFYEFIIWLHEVAKGKQMYFLSREGEFLKQCYDAVYGTNEKVLYVSREAVIHGSIATLLESMSMTEFLKMISVKRNETNERLIRRFGVDIQKYKSLLVEEEIDLKEQLTDKTIRFLEKYREDLIHDTRKYEKIFWEYLQQNFNVDKENILLVDIGWNGNMQKLLTQYLYRKNKNIQVEGAYFGCMDDKGKHGFLFCRRNARSADVLTFSGLLECITMPSYGTVLGYQKQKERVEPVFRVSEQTPESQKIIKLIQRGILDLCNKMVFWKGISVFDKEEVIEELISYGRSPNKRDVSLIGGGIMVYENGRIYPLVDVPKRKDFLLPKNAYYKFLECNWKAGWMMAVFKLPFPWYYFFRVLRKWADQARERKEDN